MTRAPDHSSRELATRVRAELRFALALLVALLPVAAVASEGALQILPELPPFLSERVPLFPPGYRLIQLLLLFFLLIAPVNALVVKPLLRVLDERNERIAGTRSRAERVEKDAAEILARYESSLRRAREEAERGRRSLLEEVRAEVQRETASARRDAEGQIERARSEVARSLGEARGTLRAQAQELARQAASQVLGRAL